MNHRSMKSCFQFIILLLKSFQLVFEFAVLFDNRSQNLFMQLQFCSKRGHFFNLDL
jgi:hypothetical protein